MPAVRVARGERARARPGRLGHARRPAHRARLGLDDHARGRAPGQRGDLRGRHRARGCAPPARSLLADELRVMLDGVADAITVQSPDHKLIYANEAAARCYGIPRGQALDDFRRRRPTCGASTSTDELGRPLDLARLPGPARARGPEARAGARSARATRRPARCAGRGSRPPRSATPTAACGWRSTSIEDITELKRSEEAQRFLAEASRRLSRLLAGLRAHAGGGRRAGGAGAGRLRARRPGRRRRRCPAEAVEVMRTGAALARAARG